MNEVLLLSADFDGANPKQDGIRETANRQFTIDVYSETPDESFRMETMIVNKSRQKESLRLEINWPTEPFSELRDCLYMKNEAETDWSPVIGLTAPGRTVLELTVPSGKTLLCLHPHYGFDDCERYIAQLESPYLEKLVAGKSENGRTLWLLKANDAAGPCKNFLITARNHANESSGSYCIEGMMDWILSDDPIARYARKRICFCFMPMTNPDGVADGMARFTGTKFADMNKTPEWLMKNRPGALPDKGHEACHGVLDQLKPAAFMNLHSYLFKYKDEIYGRTEKDIDNFLRFVPDQVEHGKIWRRTVEDQVAHPTGYCNVKYGTLPLLIEIPWFGRTQSDMRILGVKLIKAMIFMKTVDGRAWGEI